MVSDKPLHPGQFLLRNVHYIIQTSLQHMKPKESSHYLLLTIYFKATKTAPTPIDDRPETSLTKDGEQVSNWVSPPPLCTEMDACVSQADHQTATVSRGSRRTEAAPQWELVLLDYKGNQLREEAPLAFSPVLCLRWPSLILLISSWGFSKGTPWLSTKTWNPHLCNFKDLKPQN